ncbi:unnamed protein product, partial [Brachionus calyciflorus]
EFNDNAPDVLDNLDEDSDMETDTESDDENI